MDSKRIAVLKTSFDELSHAIPEEKVEYWLARDNLKLLGNNPVEVKKESFSYYE